MFVPLHDENPLKSIHFQYVTILLIAINVAVFFFEFSGVDDAMLAGFALIPSELFGTSLLPVEVGAGVSSPQLPEGLTLVTYMFFHDDGDFVHILFNMLFLWVFGDNVEDAMGHVRFLIFYLACGVFAGLMHAWILPTSENPLIGASGAVAGVIAAYIMLHPHVRVWVLALKFIPLRISAAFALGLWIAIQIVMVMLPQMGPVAWWAHIGGLIAGAVLVIFLRRPGVPLFNKGLGTA